MHPVDKWINLLSPCGEQDVDSTSSYRSHVGSQRFSMNIWYVSEMCFFQHHFHIFSILLLRNIQTVQWHMRCCSFIRINNTSLRLLLLLVFIDLGLLLWFGPERLGRTFVCPSQSVGPGMVSIAKRRIDSNHIYRHYTAILYMIWPFLPQL